MVYDIKTAQKQIKRAKSELYKNGYDVTFLLYGSVLKKGFSENDVDLYFFVKNELSESQRHDIFKQSCNIIQGIHHILFFHIENKKLVCYLGFDDPNYGPHVVGLTKDIIGTDFYEIETHECLNCLEFGYRIGLVNYLDYIPECNWMTRLENELETLNDNTNLSIEDKFNSHLNAVMTALNIFERF